MAGKGGKVLLETTTTAAAAAAAAKGKLKKMPMSRSARAGLQVGIYGYTAYSTSKFRLRGMAEALQQEVIGYDIHVSLIFPPYIDTPGLVEENKRKPELTSIIDVASGVIKADEVAKFIFGQHQIWQFFIPCNLEGFALCVATAELMTRKSGGSRGSKVAEQGESITFADEAKKELEEIVEFLRNPDKYIRLGARPAGGVLLVGLPVTCKILLAKAVAEEADVPFISCSASEFMELYVGMGTSRVRDIFARMMLNVMLVFET